MSSASQANRFQSLPKEHAVRMDRFVSYKICVFYSCFCKVLLALNELCSYSKFCFKMVNIAKGNMMQVY